MHSECFCSGASDGFLVFLVHSGFDFQHGFFLKSVFYSITTAIKWAVLRQGHGTDRRTDGQLAALAGAPRGIAKLRGVA